MKELERDLGLPSVLAISIGAMIGSGIFILPALALEIAGPAVVLAYLLAGLLVVPAALSKSEMATAMPEAGGTYIYIERGMGPLLGTIAGVGTWFSLSFKGALALVGGVPYLLLLFDLPLQPVALGLATLLILVNVVGAKQTGRLQLAIVVVMLAALGWFAAGSAPSVDAANYTNFFGSGVGGLLAATGLVFVSYAGVTKVASIAEEVEDPGRNIPLGILGSLAFTTVLYVAIVAVLVGITDPGSVAGSLTPVAVAAEVTLGRAGVVAVIAAAILVSQSFAAPATVTGDVDGNVTGTVTNETTGEFTGQFEGALSGNLDGTVSGQVSGTLDNDTAGEFTAPVDGTVTGQLPDDDETFEGTLDGLVNGSVTGDVSGNVTGAVTKNATTAPAIAASGGLALIGVLVLFVVLMAVAGIVIYRLDFGEE